MIDKLLTRIQKTAEKQIKQYGRDDTMVRLTAAETLVLCAYVRKLEGQINERSV